jgi:hypothetical protein
MDSLDFLLLLPVELFIQIANELSFRQRLALALDTDYFGFMFMLTEIWSMSIPNLVLEDVEIISSTHNPKSLLAALEFLIPTNAIKRFSIDINDKVLPWSDGDILNMIRIHTSLPPS